MVRYYCNVCKKTITKRVYEYSMKNNGKPLCIEHQKTSSYKPYTKKSYPKTYKSKAKSKITPQARKLYNALKKRKIFCKLEAKDGYKSVDISIEWAGIDIEVDGKQHIFNSKQLYSDIQRTSYSMEDGKHTIRIPNSAIDENVNGVADSIAKVVRRKYKEDDIW